MKHLLNKSAGQLNRLLENASVFQTLLDIAQDRLPQELARNLLGVCFEQQSLVLQIEHEIWATQIRFYEADLLGTFQTNFPHLQLNRIKIQVIPRRKEVESAPYKREGLSEDNAEAFLQTSQKVKSKGLKTALERLSQHRRTEE